MAAEKSVWTGRYSLRLTLALLMLLLAGCATYAPDRLGIPAELDHVQSKTLDDVTISIAVLTDRQAQRHFGFDLQKQDVQAVWIQVRNASHRKLWFIRNMLDPDFYSADEVALMAQEDIPDGLFDDVRQRIRDDEIRALMQPLTITEGFIFLPRVEGGRYIDVSLHGDAWDEDAEHTRINASHPRELRFGFAVALPDGDFDYELLDPSSTYVARTLPELDEAQLRSELENLPCCTTDAKGSSHGDPLNIVLVGDAADVLNALSRSGWSFTHRINLHTIVREIGAVLNGDSYPVAPVSSLYALGRKHDVALQRARRTVSQRNHMRLWLAPFRFQSRQIWIGQISRDIGVKFTTKSPTLTTHIIDPEVDNAREYLLHSLISQRLVERFGFVKGSAQATRDAPRLNLTDDPYFSDGMRLVLIIASEPVAVSKIRNLMWERSAAPVAEGQSSGANRNVRPIALSE